MALFAERVSAPLPFLQPARQEQDVVVQQADDEQQQRGYVTPIQCTDAAADEQLINFSIEEVNFVKENSELVCG